MKFDFKKNLIQILLAAVIGVLTGSASAFFLWLLGLVTNYRENHISVLFLLPFIGILIAWVYDRFGKESHQGTNLVFIEIHTPAKKVPLRMAPFVLFGTILTHLGGGSAGREGTAVQMGGAIADNIVHRTQHWFKNITINRKHLLMAGLASGFAAAVGAPWAGFVFGLEVLIVGRPQWLAAAETLVAAWIGYWMVGLWGVAHTHYPQTPFPEWHWALLIWMVLLGAVCGASAFCFYHFEKWLAFLLSKKLSNPMKAFFGGALLVILFFAVSLWTGNFKYCGLGLGAIKDAFLNPAKVWDPIVKLFFTALTLASGFKGGEFIPLVFVGTTWGSALSGLTSLAPGFLTTLGFVAVFGAASNTPIACSIMTAELFGWEYFLPTLLVQVVAFYFSGHTSIYKHQQFSFRKWAWFQEGTPYLLRKRRFWKK